VNRLEEIKLNNTFKSNPSIDWLISEIERFDKEKFCLLNALDRRAEEEERLRKEKEWQLNQIIKYKVKLYFDCYGPGNEGRLIALKETEEEMHQALKEETDE